MSTYMMRQIDNDLMREVKTKTAADGLTVRTLLVWLMRLYVKRGLSAFEAIDGKYPRSQNELRTNENRQ